MSTECQVFTFKSPPPMESAVVSARFLKLQSHSTGKAAAGPNLFPGKRVTVVTENERLSTRQQHRQNSKHLQTSRRGRRQTGKTGKASSYYRVHTVVCVTTLTTPKACESCKTFQIALRKVLDSTGGVVPDQGRKLSIRSLINTRLTLSID